MNRSLPYLGLLALVLVTFCTMMVGLRTMSPEAYHNLGQSALAVVGMVNVMRFHRRKWKNLQTKDAANETSG